MSAEHRDMTPAEHLAHIGRARDEAAQAIRYARKRGKWPDDISPEAHALLAHDLEAQKIAQEWEAAARRRAALGRFFRLGRK